jgi:hypothetical protein
MNGVIVCLGYRCLSCLARVAVLRSTDPPTEDSLPDTIESVCRCGCRWVITRKEIVDLEVWTEEVPSPALKPVRVTKATR